MLEIESGPLFLLRAERGEGRFIGAHSTELHGVVLHGRHLAPYPKESKERSRGLRGDELAQEVRALGLGHVHDPDTALLPYLHGNGTDAAFGRAALMASAGTVAPGLTTEELLDEEALRDLVVATLAPQRDVTYGAAPYFRFGALDDPWLAVNLRAAALTQRLLRGAPVALFVQGDLPALRAGALAHAADRFAELLNPRGLTFLQVAGLEVEAADPRDLLAYLHAIDAWTRRGFRTIADRVGRFGVAAVAAGAAGMACGLRFYRTTRDLDLEFQYARSGPVRYWSPVRGDRLSIEDARKRARRGSLPPCPVEGCAALADDTDSDEIRLHDIHLTRVELLEAADDPGAVQRRLSTSPIGYVRTWGEALAALLRISKQA
jgi:hypothetical protein